MTAARPSFRQSAAGLHSWAGLLPGWVLFIVFLFGTTAFFKGEITQWMQPELRVAPLTAAGLDSAGAFLGTYASEAESWSIDFPSDRDPMVLTLSWRYPEGFQTSEKQTGFDPSTGKETTARDTQGGQFLYLFHFDLYHMPLWLARSIVGIGTLAMLVAILSGIVTHRKIFSEFFTLRFGKGQRSWLDAHNAAAVLALPFHLMITYTGLVTLLFSLMPWAISANFADRGAFIQATQPPPPEMNEKRRSATLLPLHALVARAEAEWAGVKVRHLRILNPGDAGATAELWPQLNDLGAVRATVQMSGVTGELLRSPRSPAAAAATQGAMIDLHAGRFSAPALRWLYFLSGVGGTVMVASGLVLWTVKRRAKLPDLARPHLGFRLVEWLNIGVIAGAPAGIAVYFLANRLLPIGMTHRADWEINALFIAWGALCAWSAARPTRRAWVDAQGICAMLFALVPVVSALTTRRGLISSLIARDWVFVGFDLTMLMTAGACALAAWKTASHRPTMAPHGKVRGRPEAVV